MLTEICAEIRNYFVKEIHEGTFEIVGGNIMPLDFLQEGQYFRIVGSVFNDGVHQYPTGGLADEIFEGAVWALAIPPTLIALTEEIKTFCQKHESEASPYTSESFGGYTYTKATDSNGTPVTWRKVFSSRLNKWRKI